MNPTSAAPSRPILAVLCNELPPYRVHWHRRIAREIPEFTLRTLLFPARVPSPWTPPDDPALGLIRFDPKRPPGAERVNVLRARDYSDRHPDPAPLSLRLRTLWAERQERHVLLRWIEEHRPAAMVINGHAPQPFSSALRLAGRLSIPAFVWADSNIHDDRARGWRLWAKKLILRPLLANAAAILPCGSNGRAYYERYTPPGKPMFYCPNEPDYDEIARTTPSAVEGVRARFGLDPSRRRIIFVGRLVRLKRVDTLIDAFTRLAADRPEWDLLIVGDGPLRTELESRVPAVLKDRVCWTGFISNQPTVNALYRTADVMVLPSENEAWALVVNEAAASGLAMVVSEVVGAAPELVRDGVNGRLFSPGEVAALTKHLCEVTREGPLASMKQASREIVAEWRSIGDPIEGLRRALRLAGVQ
jgi:glycosyltransferase involved in cell wall biosynthesis